MRNKEKKISLYPQDYVLKDTIIPLIPEYISPNILTKIRFILTPIVFLLLLERIYSFGIPLFLIAAFTDMLDGSIARVKNRITPWGIMSDPIADKLLIGSVVLLFIFRDLSFLLGILIISIELLTVCIGLLFKNKYGPIPSNIFGKSKMVLQVIGILAILLNEITKAQIWISLSVIFLSVSIIFAFVSLIFNFMHFSKKS